MLKHLGLPYNSSVIDQLKKNARYYADLFLRQGISLFYTKKPTTNDEKITACISIYNEPFMIPSILSVKNIVDEYIIVDSSTENQRSIISELASEHDLSIEYIWKKCNLKTAYQTALDKASTKFIMRMEADSVYFSKAGEIIHHFLNKLSKNRYYEIFYPKINIDKSIKYQNANCLYNFEARIYTNSSKIRFVSKNDNQYFLTKTTVKINNEFLDIPSWYRKRCIDKPLALHLHGLKPFERSIWTDSRLTFNENDPDIYLKKYLENLDQDKLKEKYLIGYKSMGNLLKYTGEIPEILKPYL